VTCRRRQPETQEVQAINRGAVGARRCAIRPVSGAARQIGECGLDLKSAADIRRQRRNRFRSFSSSLRIYISSAGRAFTKEGVVVTGGGRGGGPAAESVQAPDDARNSRGGNHIVHFEGGALLVDNPLIAGARRISITFDAAYTSCKANVTWGREGGAGPIRQRSWINGRRFEVVSIQTSTPTCSVVSGNVFGGQ
jgi:hypothetical protein